MMDIRTLYSSRKIDLIIFSVTYEGLSKISFWEYGFG